MSYIKTFCFLICALATGSNVFGVSYSYDSLNRLTNVDYGNGSVISYTYDPAGNRLTYSAVVSSDTTPPTIAITSPTSGPSYTNSTATINLSGTASDNVGVTLVTWQNYSGGLGVATGTNSWSITGIPLKPGANVISVTAYDAAGNSSNATLTVTKVVAAPPQQQLTGITMGTGSMFQFNLNGSVGSDYAIQASSNLVNWVNLVTNVIPGGGLRAFAFPIMPNQPTMFYRALPTIASPSITSVIAWGYNNYGQTNVPSGLTNVSSISSGASFNLALKADGTVVEWGDNGFGQTNVPTNVTNVTTIAAGSYHSLALTTNGSVVAWGYNGFGQATVPSNATNVVGIAAGLDHSAVLKSDGTVICWGLNGDGEANVPAGLSNVVAIAAGGKNTIALKNDGTVIVWGSNDSGQINVPIGLTNAIAIACGTSHCLALKSDGTLAAWGFLSSIPAGLTNCIAIACGFDHDLVVNRDGSVVAWGQNAEGQCNVPSNVTNAISVAGGQYDSVTLIRTAAVH